MSAPPLSCLYLGLGIRYMCVTRSILIPFRRPCIAHFHHDITISSKPHKHKKKEPALQPPKPSSSQASCICICSRYYGYGVPRRRRSEWNLLFSSIGRSIEPTASYITNIWCVPTNINITAIDGERKLTAASRSCSPSRFGIASPPSRSAFLLHPSPT